MKMESIPFEIAYCSSFDVHYEPEQLVNLNFENDFIVQNKTHRGWQTKKNPEYPQDLIVQLNQGVCRISKVEILSHHYKIASQIELYTGITKEKEHDSLYIQFTRLGFVNLDNNNRFQDRELKSIKVQADCEYIRLVVKGCHENRLNIYKQVGFLALNVLGYPVDQVPPMIEHPISPTYDIDFNLESWIQVIRNAEEESAQDEDYKEAKIYKELGDRLTGLWKFLMNLENEKQQAVAEKDNDEAEKIKADMLQVKQNAENLLKQSGIQINSEGELLPYDIQDTIDDDHSSIDTLEHNNENESKLSRPIPPPSDQLLEEAIANWTSFDALSMNNKMKQTSSTKTHQSARLPLHTQKQEPELLVEEEPVDPETIPEPLTADDREYCELPIALFGENMISCIMSVKVKCRQNGLNQLSQLIELESSIDLKFIQATIIMLQEAIMDSRESIFNQTIQSWKDLQTIFKSSDSKKLYGWIEKFFTRLVSRTNDSNPGIKTSATKTVLELIKSYHDLLLLCLKERMIRNLKDAKARIDLITYITKQFLVKEWKRDTQLYRQPLMAFIVTYLKHPHKDIQKLTWDLLLLVAKHQQRDADFKAISAHLDTETVKKLQVELRKKLSSSTSSTARELRALAVKNTTPQQQKKKVNTTKKDTQRNTTTKKKIVKEKKKPVLQEDEDEEKVNKCIFCDEVNDDFNEDTLISHYYNYCPVLTNCPMCQIILEVSTLNEHLQADCDKKHLVKQCSTCRQSIPVEQWLQHSLKKTCTLNEGQSRCPFCQVDMTQSTESSWKTHLIHKCTKNPRKK